MKRNASSTYQAVGAPRVIETARCDRYSEAGRARVGYLDHKQRTDDGHRA